MERRKRRGGDRAEEMGRRRWSGGDGAEEMERRRWSGGDGAEEMEQRRWSGDVEGGTEQNCRQNLEVAEITPILRV